LKAVDTSQERLEPPNEHAHFVLPSLGKSASASARSHDSIMAVHPQGISFIDQLGAMEGFLTVIGGMGAAAAATPLYFSATAAPGLAPPLWLDFWMALLLLVCLLVIRSDTLTYRYRPVLINRAAGKVHCFVSEGLSWWKLWQLRPPAQVQTWDWACVRGEVVEFTVLGGGGVPRREYALMFAVVDAPGSRRVVARFGVGLSSSWNAEFMVQRWEHIRRYMRGEGPPLAPGDTLFTDDSTKHLWAALTFGQPLLGPGSGEYWSGKALNGWWFLTIPMGLIFLGLLPFTMAAGLLRWASHKLKREPKWPAEILASVGGAALSPVTAMTPGQTWTQRRKATKRAKSRD
jgi:hypothetical protein